MSNHSYRFDLPSQSKSIIKVIGVGGGGSNAVNHMYNRGIKDVEFVVCNTDSQALTTSPVPNRLQIGANLTEGLGAGANPEKGRDAALESKEEIRDLLSVNTKMLFITAGMGGGTGTGAAPVLAQIARELGILTVGIVTSPFSFEGKKKIQQAMLGIEALKQNCDTVLIISNDKVREIFGNLPMGQAFAQADNILTTAAKGIAEIITVAGYVNVDFEDVKTVMRDSGSAVMGSAKAEGENRALRAVEEALSSPLLDNRSIKGAQKVLLSIMSGEKFELQMDEFTEITDFVQEKVGDEAEMIFGNGIDASLGESIRVTIIATGFKENPEDEEKKRRVIDLDSNRTISFEVEPEKVNKPSLFNTSIEERTNFIEKTTPQVDPPMALVKEPTKVVYDLNEEIDAISDRSMEEGESEEDRIAEMEKKKEKLLQQAHDRINKLKKLSSSYHSDNYDTYKEKIDVPAYLRKNVKLKEVPHSSEKKISRYSLNDENQIVGNNKFFHDKPD